MGSKKITEYFKTSSRKGEGEDDDTFIEIVQEATQTAGKRLRINATHSYSDEMRYKIGRYALENTNIKAAEKFSKMLGHSIPESTIRNFKTAYKQMLKQPSAAKTTSDTNSDSTPSTSCSTTDSTDLCEDTAVQSSSSVEVQYFRLAKKKRGKKPMLPEELESKIWQYVEKVRKSGGIISTTLVLAIAKGIIKKHRPTLLQENGGPIMLLKSWAYSLLKRHNYVKRKATKAARKLPRNFNVQKGGFLENISRTVHLYKIPKDLVFNFDQTGLPLVPTSNWTMAECGSKQIDVVGKDDKRNITALLTVTATGKLLPPQVLMNNCYCHTV